MPEEVAQSIDSPTITTEPLIVPLIEGDEGYVPDTGTVPEAAPAPQELDDYTRQRLQVADRLEVQQQETQVTQSINADIQTLRQELAGRNYTPEEVEWHVARETKRLQQFSDERQNFRNQQAFEQRRTAAAQSIGQKHGVDPQLLMNATDTPQMEEMALREKRYLDQDKRLVAVEQKTVPAQNMNQTNSRAGGQAVTSDNVDQLYNQGRITGTQYREFLDKVGV